MNENTHKLNSPKSFFTWLGIMASLYVSVFSLVILLFELINYAFPDDISYYIDPSAGAIRGAMAVLIVAFPLYVYLTRVANQRIRKNEAEREHPFRKWLIYFTLFASGVTLAIDLAVVINAFLGGDLTSRFLLKSVAIFVIVGFLFYYYLSDLRNKWQENEALSKKLGAVAGLIVLASIVAGFLVVGSPANQRLLKFDNEKVNDLSSITWEVENYYSSNESLPESLDEIREDFYAKEIFIDPQSGEQYGYKVIDEKTYELCAEFNLETKSLNSRAYPIYPLYDWTHTAGENCFERTINPEIIKPIIR